MPEACHAKARRGDRRQVRLEVAARALHLCDFSGRSASGSASSAGGATSEVLLAAAVALLIFVELVTPWLGETYLYDASHLGGGVLATGGSPAGQRQETRWGACGGWAIWLEAEGELLPDDEERHRGMEVRMPPPAMCGTTGLVGRTYFALSGRGRSTSSCLA